MATVDDWIRETVNPTVKHLFKKYEKHCDPVIPLKGIKKSIICLLELESLALMEINYLNKFRLKF